LRQKHIPDVSSLNNELDVLSKKSDSCLVLSKNILQIKALEAKIPDFEYIQQLKKDIRNMRLSILGKKLSSIFLSQNAKEIKKLKQNYEKNQKYLEEIVELQKNYNHLKKQCENDFTLIYSDKNSHPDRDALNFEFKIYTVLEDKYLPAFREKEIAEMDMRLQIMDREVYMLYLESLRAKIDLINIKTKGLNTELYIEINKRNNLHGRYINLLSSLEYHKKSVDKLVRAIISEIIDDADLIATTAVSSCHYFLDDVTFDVMIMDEASQVASFMSLLPLLKCKKFVLVGDNKQLQPIEEENISKEMNLSIFNRLFEMYPVASSMLTIQYRMHNTIAQIANEIFYEGKLRTSEEVAEKILSLKPSKHQFLNPKIPAMFIDTSKVGYYEEEVGSGCSNSEEAKYVAYLVSLFIKNGVRATDIGIITPYVKQELLIKEFLKDIEINDVEVNTVHKFQGREKDVIIMSFARSKKYAFPKYKLKFIENETLVNVAITRAKKKLLLIGNSDTLRQSMLLNRIINKIGMANKITL
jgi:hypothetical protein